MSRVFFFQKILPCTNTFLKCTSPAPAPPIRFLMVRHIYHRCLFLFSCHDSHDSVKGATVAGKVQKRNRNRASFCKRYIHKTTSVLDYELLGEAEYFPRLTGHIFHNKTRSYRTVKETKVNRGIILSMFSETSRLQFFNIAGSAVPKSLPVNLDQC